MIWALCILLCLSITIPKIHCKYNIALHAQVHPESHNKVVGSVITTDGLKKAFSSRIDVDTVNIFYPGHYSGFTNTTWDFLLIEGWFPSIYEFLQLSRNNFPDIIIIFYCLDPVYPPLNVTFELDVDGILTNSRVLESQFQKRNIPSKFIMLAADPELMIPIQTIKREYGAVYVGAGGHMINSKPTLYQTLINTIPYSLRLHGVGWNEIPVLRDQSLGPLPRYELANAYSSSHSIIAATIESQDKFGMINNRVFEALSCGNIVINQFSDTLFETFGDLLTYYNDPDEISSILNSIINDDKSELRRENSRKFILNGHTWEHRTIEIMNFFIQLSGNRKKEVSKNSFNSFRPNKRKLLWIVSTSILLNGDYQFVLEKQFRQLINKLFLIDYFTEDQFFQEYSQICNIRDSVPCKNFLSAYDFVLSFISPLDKVDRFIQTLDFPLVSKNNMIQRRAGYLFGISPETLQNSYHQSYDHYDLIFFRNYFEINIFKEIFSTSLPESRLQHAFGLGIPDTLHFNQRETTVNTEKNWPIIPLILCFSNHKSVCTEMQIKTQVNKFNSSDFILMLLGGSSFSEWLNNESLQNNNQLLKNIIHIKDGEGHPDFIDILKHSSAVVLLNEPRSIFENNTISSIIYPLVLAAVFQKPIQLLSHDASLLTAVDYGCNDWTEAYLLNSTKWGLNRLAGFPSYKHHVTINEVVFERNIHNQVISTPYLSDNLQTFPKYMDYLIADLDSYFAVIKINYNNFLVGRDGQVCIQAEHAKAENIICLMRQLDYLIIKLQSSPDKQLPRAEHFNIILRLQGSLYIESNIGTTYSIPMRKPLFEKNSFNFSTSEKIWKASINELVVTYEYPNVNI